MNAETPHTGPQLAAGPLRLLAVAALIAGCCAMNGCYQRVVKDSRGTYSGTVHEGNLPDDTNGFWSDAFETSRVVPREQSSEAQRIRSRNQALYESQTKGLGRNSGSP